MLPQPFSPEWFPPLSNVCRSFWLLHLGRECYWHLLYRGAGCCHTSYGAQDRDIPLPKKYLAPNVSSVTVQKPWAAASRLSSPGSVCLSDLDLLSFHSPTQWTLQLHPPLTVPPQAMHSHILELWTWCTLLRASTLPLYSPWRILQYLSLETANTPPTQRASQICLWPSPAQCFLSAPVLLLAF